MSSPYSPKLTGLVARNIEMCLLPMLRASNNILKGMIYRTSILHFVSSLLSFFFPAPHAFYFLFPHLSLSIRNLYNFYRILLSSFAWSHLQYVGHAARRDVLWCSSPPPARLPFGQLHVSLFSFTLK